MDVASIGWSRDEGLGEWPVNEGEGPEEIGVGHLDINYDYYLDKWDKN